MEMITDKFKKKECGRDLKKREGRRESPNDLFGDISTGICLLTRGKQCALPLADAELLRLVRRA
ncbi:MAG: hypothetical protein B6245_06105 [Desulfobacteraceae bacterium 4572_88]|nr:MAG: hypothetical protein B6245_06105 [Desulfobacteraceae bacterium 4572_88]